MVLNQIKNLSLSDFIILKNTLENPENRDYHFEQTQRTTVPCLYIDGKPLFESRDICQWLIENKDSITKG